jgi:hypothetical protein
MNAPSNEPGTPFGSQLMATDQLPSVVFHDRAICAWAVVELTNATHAMSNTAKNRGLLRTRQDEMRMSCSQSVKIAWQKVALRCLPKIFLGYASETGTGENPFNSELGDGPQ